MQAARLRLVASTAALVAGAASLGPSTVHAQGDASEGVRVPGVVVMAVPLSPDSIPEIASWLVLRRAAIERDSAARAALYARVTLPIARARIPWVEAEARERADDLVGALRAYASIPSQVDVFRLRLELADSDSTHVALKREMAGYVAAAAAGDPAQRSNARRTLTLLERVPGDIGVEGQLRMARIAVQLGLWEQARSAYANVDRRQGLGNTDRFQYANALARGGQRVDAAAEYARVRGPASLVAAARYQRARMLLMLDKSSAMSTQLSGIQQYYPNDTSTALALWLRADLASDVGRDSAARSLWLDVARRFPSFRLARPARFNAAMVAFIQGRHSVAVREFGALASSGELSARYWWARAQAAAGDSAAARNEWRAILSRDSTSYYAVLAAQHLDTYALHGWIDAGAIAYPHIPAVDSASRRITLLDSLNMSDESRFEADALVRDAGTSRDRLLATAAALDGTQYASRAIALGTRALNTFGPSAAAYRVVYPIAERETIIDASRSAGVDPILVAALIRQESNFNPSARSPVGARGLMQLMPSVAAGIAKQMNVAPWSVERLYDPALNIRLGVAHLAPLLRVQPNVVHVLAAYNAGESRVVRWRKKAGANDPEIFTERIPYAETREYVKSILRNREFYRVLYSW